MTKIKKMKNKDYFHLAKQSLKSRKKSTRTTVAGISFGLILILPVLYFCFAFYLDFNSKINSIPTVAMFNIGTTVEQSTDYVSSDTYSAYGIRGTNTIDEMLSTIKHDEDVICFNRYAFINSEIYYSVNNSSPIILRDTYTYNNNNPNPSFYALDYDMSNGKLANTSTINYLKDTHNKELIVNGNNFTPATKGKGELILSETYAKNNYINVGDTISMNFKGQIYSDYGSRIDNDNNPNNYYDYKANSDIRDDNTYNLEFMKNFKVVGLVAAEYYKGIATRADPMMFITTASYINSNGTKNAPTVKMATNNEKDSNGYTREENYQILTYPTDYVTLCDTATANGQMAMLHGIATCIGLPNNSTYSRLAPISQERLLRVQFDNYAAAQKAAKLLDGRISALNKNMEDTSYSNDLFDSYKMINMIGTIIISVFLVFGGVILFATMVNLYNSIQYSVESRRNYMGMLRAVGAKNNVLHRMYFTEVILIFLKSLPWILILGGGICVGLKFAIDAIFSYMGEMMGLILSLSLWYIPVVFGLLFMFAFLVGIIYSRICCKPITTRGILTLLKEDR